MNVRFPAAIEARYLDGKKLPIHGDVTQRLATGEALTDAGFPHLCAALFRPVLARSLCMETSSNENRHLSEPGTPPLSSSEILQRFSSIDFTSLSEEQVRQTLKQEQIGFKEFAKAIRDVMTSSNCNFKGYDIASLSLLSQQMFMPTGVPLPQGASCECLTFARNFSTNTPSTTETRREVFDFCISAPYTAGILVSSNVWCIGGMKQHALFDVANEKERCTITTSEWKTRAAFMKRLGDFLSEIATA